MAVYLDERFTRLIAVELKRAFFISAHLGRDVVFCAEKFSLRRFMTGIISKECFSFFSCKVQLVPIVIFSVLPPFCKFVDNYCGVIAVFYGKCYKFYAIFRYHYSILWQMLRIRIYAIFCYHCSILWQVLGILCDLLLSLQYFMANVMYSMRSSAIIAVFIANVMYSMRTSAVA